LAKSLLHTVQEVITEIHSEVHNNLAICDKLQETAAIVIYCYRFHNYTMTLYFGETLLGDISRCQAATSLPDDHLSDNSIRIRHIMAKTRLFQLEFYQGIKEMDNLLQVTLSNHSHLKQEIAEMCFCLIVTFRYITTCYPNIASIPSQIPIAFKYLFVLPLDPYPNNSPEESSHDQQSTVPELCMFSQSKDTVKFKDSEIREAMYFQFYQFKLTVGEK